MKLGRFKLLARRTIHDFDGQPYLRRWTLVETPWFKLMLHHILRSDADRELHDHPYDFTSLILWGGYLEHLEPPAGSELNVFRWREVGTLVRHQAEDLHRIELPAGCTAWTLVFCGRRRRTWGFKTKFGWMPWERYVALRRQELMEVPERDLDTGRIA